MIKYAQKYLQRGLILLLIANPFSVFAQAPDLNQQDAQFREDVVGNIQVNIENAMIEANNGVFILFTPTQGTPQMISEQGDIPLGLIPSERMKSYESTVKPRVKTTHQMPAADIKCIFIRHHAHRPRADNPSQQVDEVYYQQLLTQYPNQIVDRIIPEQTFTFYQQQSMPAAFYYFMQNGKIQYAAIFGKQINARIGNKLTDPRVYYNRPQDLAIANTLLIAIGLKTVEEIHESIQKQKTTKENKMSEKIENYCLAVENKAFSITLQFPQNLGPVLLLLTIRAAINEFPKPKLLADSLIDKHIAKGIQDAEKLIELQSQQSKSFLHQFKSKMQGIPFSFCRQARNGEPKSELSKPRARL